MTYSATGSATPKSNISGYRKIPNFTPEQMNLFKMLLGGTGQGLGGGGLDYLSRLASGDESAFAESEAPAYSAYEKALGQLGSRFAGLGAMDSSAFQNATSGAASTLAENLAANRSNLQQSAIDKLLGLSQSLLGQQPYSYERKPSGWESFGSLLGSASKFLPFFL